GVTIRALVEETGAQIEVADDGTVTISSNDSQKAEMAIARIQDIAAEVEVGKIYHGTVLRVVDYGAFINVIPGRNGAPGKDGLVHISQISQEKVTNINEKIVVGSTVRVKVTGIDDKGRVQLSMKAVAPEEPSN
ncbi:MAG: S1 RNA-binding domain-containing protein, partial [Gammaproteobacteria bacterium]|nr:S1 RNA-binding domain-containing protein [Gammaproteobacteria bacterium]